MGHQDESIPTLNPMQKEAKKRRSRWPIIVAIAVAAVVIGAGAYAVVWNESTKKLEVTVRSSSSSYLTNDTIELSASVSMRSKNVTEGQSTDMDWTVTPVGGAFIVESSKSKLTLRAGLASTILTVTCSATYAGIQGVGSKNLTIALHSLASLMVDPGEVSINLGGSAAVSARAISDRGIAVPGAMVTWRMAGTDPDCVHLNRTSGDRVTVSAYHEGNATLIASTKYNGVQLDSAAEVTVIEPPRKVDYRWYDMFNVPFDEWWFQRWERTSVEQPWSTAYPYIFLEHGTPLGDNKFHSNMRLNVTGSFMTEINMNSNPQFLPTLGGVFGGNATIDWYLQYLNHAEFHEWIPPMAEPDGWLIELAGTTTLDRRASMAVLGVNSTGFDDFAVWWAANNESVSENYTAWLLYEGNERLDIYPMYEYPLTILGSHFWASKEGDNIVLHYDYVSWGMEALMTRWLHEAFMPCECWFEDMDFHAVLTDYWANISIDTVAAYALEAGESLEQPGAMAWIWEPTLQDCIPSGYIHTVSSLDPYYGLTRPCTNPGSMLYGSNASFDCPPAAFNLSEGETMTFEWPAGDQRFIRQAFNSTGVPILGSAVNFTDPISVSTAPVVGLNYSTHMLTFIGPIDVWEWSRMQTLRPWLANAWQDLGVLPYGAPWVEFWASPWHEWVFGSLVLEISGNTTSVGSPLNISVTMLDQYANIFTGYNGTVHFSSTDPLAILPSDYEFLAGDAGTHLFSSGVTFGTAGTQTVTVWDVIRTHLVCSCEVQVVP